MATINLRPTEVRQAVGLDAKQIPVPIRTLRPQNETMQLIWDTVSEAGWLSRLHICRAINRKKTPWLIGLIERMVESGYLVRELRPHLNGAMMYTYSIGEGES